MTLSFTEEARMFMNMNTVCRLPERCDSSEKLKKALTETSYQCIDLRENPLHDSDLDCLLHLTYLQILNLSDTDITGSCLPMILRIPGLQSLNIAGCSELDRNVTFTALLETPKESELNTLNICGVQFDLLQLTGLINHAFEQAAHGSFKTLILGTLEHLDDREWETLYTTIQQLETEYQLFNIIESSALKQVAEHRSQGTHSENNCKLQVK